MPLPQNLVPLWPGAKISVPPRLDVRSATDGTQAQGGLLPEGDEGPRLALVPTHSPLPSSSQQGMLVVGVWPAHRPGWGDCVWDCSLPLTPREPVPARTVSSLLRGQCPVKHCRVTDWRCGSWPEFWNFWSPPCLWVRDSPKM